MVALGLIIQYRIDADIAYKQIVWFGVGMLAMVFCILFMRYPEFFPPFHWLLMAGGIGLLAALYVVGNEQYGAKNWISIRGAKLSAFGIRKGRHRIHTCALADQQPADAQGCGPADVCGRRWRPSGDGSGIFGAAGAHIGHGVSSLFYVATGDKR